MALSALAFTACADDGREDFLRGVRCQNTHLRNALQPNYEPPPPCELEHYNRAAAKGYAPAQRALGKLYLGNTIGMEQNIRLALHWLEKAANQGDLKAQIEMGDLYSSAANNGIRQDRAKARHWYTKAAAQGAAYAQRKLDEMDGKVAPVQQQPATTAPQYIQATCTVMQPNGTPLYMYGRTRCHGCPCVW